MSPPLHVVERPAEPARARPDALPYLLVHGSMDRADSFSRLMLELRDAPVLAYDRRGYAHSTARPPSERFEDQVADLLEVTAGRPVVALGHSFGGGVVLAAAAAHPEVIRAAVVWEPPMPWLEWWPRRSAPHLDGASDPEDVAERFMLHMVGERIWSRMPEATRGRRRAEGPTLLAEMASIRQPAWDPATVGAPVLVGTGTESRPHHRRSAGELAGALPGGQLRTIPGADHGAHLTHPGPLASLLREAAAAAAVGTEFRAAAESEPLGAGEEG
ncbi:MAG TPA: alpha/beta fold hydrolase [Acidimicrobiales bacterium]|nr:alpha/beta fold hydrolase [Acidimicrobiales bacterium]